MNFDKALQAHASWKMKLSGYIMKPDQSLKVEEIAPDNLCELGIWIHENTDKYKSLPEYVELKTCHAKFHKCAADVVQRADNGEDLSGELTLGGKSDYATLSSDIVRVIMALRSKI